MSASPSASVMSADSGTPGSYQAAPWLAQQPAADQLPAASTSGSAPPRGVMHSHSSPAMDRPSWAQDAQGGAYAPAAAAPGAGQQHQHQNGVPQQHHQQPPPRRGEPLGPGRSASGIAAALAAAAAGGAAPGAWQQPSQQPPQAAWMAPGVGTAGPSGTPDPPPASSAPYYLPAPDAWQQAAAGMLGGVQRSAASFQEGIPPDSLRAALLEQGAGSASRSMRRSSRCGLGACRRTQKSKRGGGGAPRLA
jgi:hypothetical protein